MLAPRSGETMELIFISIFIRILFLSLSKDNRKFLSLSEFIILKPLLDSYCKYILLLIYRNNDT